MGETFGQQSRLAGVPLARAARPSRRLVMSPKLARPIGQPIAGCVALTAPALVWRLTGAHPPAALSLVAFGAAVVAACCTPWERTLICC